MTRERAVLRVAVPDMVSPSYFPAIAAVELGFFAEAGYDAEVELLYPVTATYEALRDGRIDLVGGAAHAPLYAFAEWHGCRLLCALSQKMYWFLVVRSDLGVRRGDVAALKGLRIGAAPGPVDGLRRLVVAAGLDPERDLSIGPVPGTAGPNVSFGVAAAQALAAGDVDGFWANGMAAEIAVRAGTGTVVVDARRDDAPPGIADFTFPALVASQRRLDDDPELASAAVRAIVRAQGALRADPHLATKAAQRHFPREERALIAELVHRDAAYYDPRISADAVTAMNRFAHDVGILTDPHVPVDRVLAPGIQSAWTASAMPGDSNAAEDDQ